MKVLINGVGGPTPRSIARSIKISKKYKSSVLLGTDINPLAYGLYEYELYNSTQVIPRAGKADYWDEISEIIENNKIEYAIVQPELEVLEWTKYRALGNELPCKTLLPDYKLVEVLVDKSKMTDLLVDSGLVPRSINIDPSNVNYNEVESVLGYPFWVRATSGSSGLGSLKVENRESLENWITINPNVTQFIGSTYLPGRNLACKLLYFEGDIIRSASGERVNYIMSKVAPSGITGNTSFGRLLNEPKLVELATKAMDILFEKLNVPKHGFFTADFKEDENGRPYITEINVRMVAFNYCFAKAGANFTEDILSLLTNDVSFDRTYKMYEFEPGTIFLRDVDADPIIMNEKDLLQ